MRFDLAKTEELERLFAVPRDERDDAWVASFYAAVPDASLATGDSQVVQGPDGFPYFRLQLPPVAQEFETFCVTHVLDVCLEHGFGIAVMGRDPRPEWVFPYGNLWSFKETGRFVTPLPEAAAEPSGQALIGSPTDDMLPPYARAALRKELEAQGAEAPGVLVVSTPDRSPAQSLAFAPMPDPERVLWYLPPHVGLMNVAPGWPEPMPLESPTSSPH